MAWEKGASAGPPVFDASTQELRRDIGLHQKASTSQLRASMERLHQQDVIFPLIRDAASGNAMFGRFIEDFYIAGGRSSLRQIGRAPSRAVVGQYGSISVVAVAL